MNVDWNYFWGFAPLFTLIFLGLFLTWAYLTGKIEIKKAERNE